MDSLGDLVTRDRRRSEAPSSLPSQDSGRRRTDDPALVAPRENRTYDYHRFCTTAWKTGNFWRRRGVHAESTVAVVDDPEPEAVFSLLGAALLGARTRFGLPERRGRDTADTRAASDLDARVVVAPHDEIGDYEVPPGSQRVGYGGPPDDPAVAHFERDVWSENPSFPETPIDPETVALVASDERGGDEADDGVVREFSHAELLAAAREVADDWSLQPGDEVAVRAPLAAPRTVIAGVVAPLLAGAAILFPDAEATGDFAVVRGDAADGAPEREVLRPADVRVD
jgi:acyl-CoA synthetase (AMP-forming)/AMP-acid ligase II